MLTKRNAANSRAFCLDHRGYIHFETHRGASLNPPPRALSVCVAREWAGFCLSAFAPADQQSHLPTDRPDPTAALPPRPFCNCTCMYVCTRRIVLLYCMPLLLRCAIHPLSVMCVLSSVTFKRTPTASLHPSSSDLHLH